MVEKCLQLSVHERVASLFGLESRTDVVIYKVCVLLAHVRALWRMRSVWWMNHGANNCVHVQVQDPSKVVASSIEVTMPDISLTRGEQWDLHEWSLGRCVYSGQRVDLYGYIRMTYSQIKIHDDEVFLLCAAPESTALHARRGVCDVFRSNARTWTRRRALF